MMVAENEVAFMTDLPDEVQRSGGEAQGSRRDERRQR